MKALQIGIVALALFLLWVVLSGFFDAFHLALGVLSVAIVMAAVWRLSIFPSGGSGADVWMTISSLRWRHALVYPFVFLLNVIKGNLQVAALVLDPKMPIDPVLLKFSCTYEKDAAKILLGNSITLTPGTVTLDIEGQDFYVHALSPTLANSLLDGSDHNRVARVFGEKTLDKVKVVMTHDPDKI